MENSETMSPGELAVGLKFNPSGDAKVQKLKELAAEMFDIVEQSVPAGSPTEPLEITRKRKIRDAALHEIIGAQMWAVKAVTFGRQN